MKRIYAAAFLVLALTTGCKTKGDSAATKKLTIKLEARSGSKVTGKATFIEKNGAVTMTANVSDLAPGVHAIHIHEKGDCSAADASSAGGHWNPTFKKHGKFGVGEYHRGDIGNFTVNTDGVAEIIFKTDEWCIGCADETKNILGKSLVIHADPDDMVSQPSGNAGGRMACSAIIK